MVAKSKVHTTENATTVDATHKVPSVGRMVHYYTPNDGPFAATVTAVNTDTEIEVFVIVSPIPYFKICSYNESGKGWRWPGIR